MFTSYRTTFIGCALIIIGVVGMKYFNLGPVEGGAIITTGLGFFAAKDSNVSSVKLPPFPGTDSSADKE